MKPDDIALWRAANRRAAERLDERPDPSVRAAVLAAARRAAAAKPVRRWPLAAAAAVIVSVMAGMVATNALHEAPERVGTAMRSSVDAIPAIVHDVASPSEAALPRAPKANIEAPPVAVTAESAPQPSPPARERPDRRSTMNESAQGATAFAAPTADVPSGEPPTPEAWVDRIVKLRESGHDFAADREIEALQRRHPGFVVPSRAYGGR